MQVRPAEARDATAIVAILMPIIRAGTAFALDRAMGEDEALAHWTGPDRETFVLEQDGEVLGTYYLRANQAGGGSHVANCGYATAAASTGQGIAAQMCEHSLERARSCGFRAMQFNFVLSSNLRAVALWQRMGFAVVGTLPGAFDHPELGAVDALVMYRAL